MTKPLLVAATSKEITLLNLTQELEDRMDILVSGVGIPNTCINLSRKLAEAKPSLVVQVGLAGSLAPVPKVGSAVAIEGDSFPELGVFEDSSFKSIFEMGLMAESNLFKDEFLINPYSELVKASGLPQVRAGTVMEISTDAGKIKRMTDKLSLKIESMEGAAFHQVCLQYEVPFLQLRGISNKVGDRDKRNWNFISGMELVSTSLSNLMREGFI
jgi:futalosine hydrolase